MKQTDLEKLLADMSLKEKVDQMLQLSGAFYLGDENSVLTGPANDMGIGKEDLEMAGSILGAAGADTMKKLHLWIILFLSFLTEDQKRLPLDLKIILLQRKCQKLGLSAVQESCHQIYHNIRLSHFSFSLSFSFRLFHLK